MWVCRFCFHKNKKLPIKTKKGKVKYVCEVCEAEHTFGEKQSHNRRMK